MNAAHKKRPGGSRGGVQARPDRRARYEPNNNALPRDWRDRLPSPATYYPAMLPSLKPHGTGWAPARCPFHDDRDASLSVHLGHGGWRCHACGLSGDLVTFHMQRNGLAFADSVRDLLWGSQ